MKVYSFLAYSSISFKADEEDLQGGIELDGDDLLFNQAIEEFIQVINIITSIYLTG